MAFREPTFSAQIYLLNKRIRYRIEKKVIEFRVEQIQLIGEYTAPPGLLPADYFFSFKLRGIDQMVDVPAYAEGLFDEVLPGLRKLLPGVGQSKLQMCHELASNVLYPAHVYGLDMFRFREVQRPLVDLPVLRRIGHTNKVERTLNPEVLSAVF
ncbi:MAG: hypothetical protein AAGN35_12455 [Bacteroidota bacterium]